MATLSKFGVPFGDGSGRDGILQPKLKYRFRVIFFSFGSNDSTVQLTQQVMNVTRPKVSYEEIPVDVYNSRAYMQGKHTWEQITITLRDDANNNITKLVGQQVQAQLNHFNQTSPGAGSNFKFTTQIDILDGGTAGDTEVEKWELEGCFLQNVDYSDSDYAVSEPVQVIMTVRFDNAINYGPGKVRETAGFGDPTLAGGTNVS